MRAAWAARSAAARRPRRGARAAGRRRSATATSSRMPRPSSTRSTRSPDEEPALDARRRQLRAAERIREDVARAAAALGPEGAEGPLLQALRWLEAAAPRGGGRARSGARRPRAGAGRARRDRARRSRTLLADLDGDPGELERVEERLFALRGAGAQAPGRRRRRCPSSPAELRGPPRRARGRRRRHRAGWRPALAAAEAAYAAAAARLSGRRGARRRRGSTRGWRAS